MFSIRKLCTLAVCVAVLALDYTEASTGVVAQDQNSRRLRSAFAEVGEVDSTQATDGSAAGKKTRKGKGKHPRGSLDGSHGGRPPHGSFDGSHGGRPPRGSFDGSFGGRRPRGPRPDGSRSGEVGGEGSFAGSHAGRPRRGGRPPHGSFDGSQGGRPPRGSFDGSRGGRPRHGRGSHSGKRPEVGSQEAPGTVVPAENA